MKNCYQLDFKKGWSQLTLKEVWIQNSFFYERSTEQGVQQEARNLVVLFEKGF